MSKPITSKKYLWLRARAKWIKDNPPSFEGYYFCYLCGQPMETRDMTLDHVVPRSRGGTHDYSNLKPCCWPCNTKKGSKVHSV